MTSASRFTFDVVANDKASETTQKITASVQALVPALEAAAAAYEKMANAQAKLGIKSSTQSNVGAQAQKDAAAVEKANNQAAKSAEASAKATFAAIAQRSAAIQTANQKEAEGLRQLADLREKALAAENRAKIAGTTNSAARMAAIQTEIQRTRELQAEKLKAVQAAQAQVGATKLSTSGSALGGTGAGASGEMSARAAAAAVQNLKNAQQSLAGTSADVARAEGLMTKEINGANQGFASQAAMARNVETQLSSARYALYQVSAAYGAMAQAAGNALKSVVQVAVGFESAFAQVSRTTNLGSEIRANNRDSAVAVAELANIKAGLEDLSTKIPTTFNDLSQVAALGAQLGIAQQDIVGFAETVTKFAATTDVTAQSTAQYFGRLQNLLDIPATKFNNLGSAVAQLGTDSVATESEILAVTTQIAAVGTNAGLSAPYVIGLGTAMASLRLAPEISRGATTRIFAEISRATAEGGEKMAAYANVLGMTSEAAATLFKTNPDQFFSTFITNLGKASDSGQNLTGVLDNLGITNTRDVQVVTRLAQGYQLLGKYTTEAATSFASGTYLNEAFQTIAETTQSSLTKMASSFALLQNAIGQSFLAPIKAVADALNGLFSWLSNLPAIVLAGVAGFVGAITIFLAFKTALTLVTGGMLAFRVATKNLGPDGLTLKGVLKLLNTEIVTQTKNSSLAAGAMGRHALATGELATATAAATLPAGVLATELGAETLAAGTAGGALTGTAVATTEVAVAEVPAIANTLGLSAAFKSLWASFGWAGVAFLAIGALVGIIGASSSAMSDSTSAAAEAAAKQKELNATWVAAGDGQQKLQDAMAADTKAYNDAAGSATQLNGVYGLVTKSAAGLADGTTAITSVYKDLRTGAESTLDPTFQAAQRADTLGTALTNVAATATPAASALDTVTEATKNQTVALGPLTEAWKQKALAEQLNTAFGSPDLKGALDALGADRITAALKAGLKGGPQAIAAYFSDITNVIQPKLATLRTQIAASQREISNAVVAGTDPAGAQANLDKYQKEFDQLSAKWTVIGTLQQKFAEVDTAIADQASSDTWSTTFKGALGDVNTEIADGTTKADALAAAIKAAQDQYDAFTQALFNSTDLAGALQNSFESLGESIANNGKDFSNFTDAGRANLQALEDSVSAFSAIQSAAIQNHEIDANQAAANTAAFIQQLMAQLSSMGIDTSQLDFLQQRIAAITGQPYTVQIGANTAPALANIQALANTIAVLKNQNPMLWGGQVAPAATAAAAKPLSPSQTVLPGFLATSVANAKAIQDAKNLAEAQKSAGKAAKSAGSAQKKAADEASAALKKQQEYVRDLASYYDNLGSKIFGAVNAEGDAFKSLQSLGQSLVDNGKSFDNITENGRKNFDALSGVFNAFGKTLGEKINQGVLTASQASQQYKEFAQGIYGELVNLGVSAEGISGIFRALGVDATGWTGNTQSVQQYAGYISAAAEAAGGLNDQLKQAEEYSKALGTSLSTAFDRFYGLSSAVDKTQTSVNALAKSYQDSIDKVNELRKTNAGLAADLSGALVEKNKAQTEQAISLRYGETARAADYGAQAQAAGSKASDLQSQISANDKEATALEVGRNALDGNTDAAIANRGALKDLQQQMLDQIDTYAAQGHTTQEVADYTEQLRGQFVQAATDAGYTSTQVEGYSKAFDNYGAAIRAVPNKLNVTATADTSQATGALNAIPKGATHVTTAVLNQPEYEYVKWKLGLIPKAADYVVTPTVGGAAGAAIGAAGVQAGQIFGGAMTNTIKSVFADSFANFDMNTFFNNGVNGLKATKYMGGLIAPNFGGFARGGMVPGTPPNDPNRDNVLAIGPNGVASIRSGEFVVRQQIVQQPGVLDFLSKLNNGDMQGYFSGGQVNAGGQVGSTVVAELAPYDRTLLSRVADAAGKGVALYVDGQQLAHSADRGNTALARRGAG